MPDRVVHKVNISGKREMCPDELLQESAARLKRDAGRRGPPGRPGMYSDLHHHRPLAARHLTPCIGQDIVTPVNTKRGKQATSTPSPQNKNKPWRINPHLCAPTSPRTPKALINPPVIGTLNMDTACNLASPAPRNHNGRGSKYSL